MERILSSVKKKLGIQEDYTHFDEDIIMDINSTFMILNQLGVGPEEPFVIDADDEWEEWSDFVEPGKIELVKSYVYLRVRLLFDPPANSFLVESINKQIQEFEFRMMVEAEKDKLYPVDMGDIYQVEA